MSAQVSDSQTLGHSCEQLRLVGSGAPQTCDRQWGGQWVKEKKIVLGIIDLTYTYHAFQNSKEHCHERGVLLMVLCSPSNPSLSSDSSESGLAHSWYLYYLENRKSTRSTSIFFQFSHAYIHSFLTLFLRHFLSTKGEDTDYLGATYLSGLSNSEKGQQDKYMCDTWEGHQVSA